VPSNPHPNENIAVVSRFCYETHPDSKQVGIYCIAEDVLQAVKIKEIGLIRKRVECRIHKLLKAVNDAMAKVVQTEQQPLQKANVLKSLGLNVSAGTAPDSRRSRGTLFFRFDDALQNLITQRITVKLAKWHGGRYRTKLKDEKDCYNKTRTYWNRQKAQQLGDELFGPILVLAFQCMMRRPHCTLRGRVLTFIAMFLALCAETIQFDRSMARPLVLNACYFKPNKWKQCCEQFIHCFGRNVHWESVKATKSTKQDGKTVYTYVRDENRSQYLHDEFLRILKIIHRQIQSERPVNTFFLKAGVDRFSQWISDTLLNHSAILKSNAQALFSNEHRLKQ